MSKEFTKYLDILPESFTKHMEVTQKTMDDGKVVMVDQKHEVLS